jgi:hypothetical protein
MSCTEQAGVRLPAVERTAAGRRRLLAQPSGLIEVSQQLFGLPGVDALAERSRAIRSVGRRPDGLPEVQELSELPEVQEVGPAGCREPLRCPDR